MKALYFTLLCILTAFSSPSYANEKAPLLIIRTDNNALSSKSDSVANNEMPTPLSLSDTTALPAPSAFTFNDSLLRLTATAPQQKKRPWLAVAECATTHLAIWGYARYIQKADFAHLNWHSFKQNLKLTHWVWDKDLMYVNFFDHPYHGNLYFNAARSNGINFWSSIAYSAGGAFLWEVVGEREILSLNDLVATTMGGMAIGETTYRLSDLALDDSRRGAGRVISEVGAGIINPMRFVTRLITGEMWQRQQQRTTFVPTRYRIAYSAGWRHLALNGQQGGLRNNVFFDLNIDYGISVEENPKGKPFDYFALSLGLSNDGHRNSVSRFNILGRFKAWQISSGSFASEVGLYQHFNYHYANAMANGEMPYRLSEAGSLGPSVAYKWEKNNWRLEQGLYTSAILIGAIMTDYPDVGANKDYNFASGFALHWRTVLALSKWLYARLDADYYRLFTWADYRTHGKMGAQGDKSVATLWLLSPRIDISLFKGLGLSFSGRFYNRHTRYSFHDNRHSHAWECHIGLQYCLGK